MRFTMKVVSAADYKSWVNRQVAVVKKAQSSACAPSGSAVTLTAKNISWNKKCLSITAGKPFQVTIDNQDAGIAHNFAVWANSSLTHRFFVTKNVTGVSTKTFTLPALPAGRYYFQCDIHGPAMSGTLIVTAPGGGTS
jgi:plastocyanin